MTEMLSPSFCYFPTLCQCPWSGPGVCSSFDGAFRVHWCFWSSAPLLFSQFAHPRLLSSPPLLVSHSSHVISEQRRRDTRRHLRKMRRWRLILKQRHLKNEVWQSCIIFVFMTSSSCSSSGGASLSWSWWRECVFESSSNRLICSSVFFLIIFISPQEIHFYMCQMVCVGKPRQILTI